MILAHHFSGRSLVVELAIVGGLLVACGVLILRERRRRARRTGPGARMRDPEP